MDRVLITGGVGIQGSLLAHKLLHRGIAVAIADNSENARAPIGSQTTKRAPGLSYPEHPRCKP